MVNIFAREITDNLASLVKQIDIVVGKNEEQQMRSFVVLLSEKPAADEVKLKMFAEKHKIKHVPLTLFDGAAGPENYKIPKDAHLTVLMWTDQIIQVSHTFEKGKLDAVAVKKIAADTKKILN